MEKSKKALLLLLSEGVFDFLKLFVVLGQE
jgi:hypothetical protein